MQINKEQLKFNNQFFYSNIQNNNNKIINLNENKFINNYKIFNPITDSIHFDDNILIKENSKFLNKTNLFKKIGAPLNIRANFKKQTNKIKNEHKKYKLLCYI